MSDDVAKGPAPAGTPRVVTPLEIQQKEFAVSRFGGYRMKDVDEFLDELTESTSAIVDENERLRRAVSDLTLDKQILAEAAKGNF